jgi:Tol biopolymer transport system component
MSSTDVGELYLVSVGGGEPKQLTFDNAGVFSSVWTADGGSIVFSSSRGGSSFTLWRISASGGMLEPLRGIGEHAVHPSISRQGNRLAYSSDVLDINIWRIELSDSTGQASSPTKLIASTRQETGPQFSPDGKRIVFDSDRSGFNEIWVCDANGANQLQLTNFGGPLVPRGTARWSPDGRRIAFDSRAEGHSDIYVINAEGGKPRRLTTGISDDMVPSWSRDGRWIYFASNRSGMRQVWKVAADGGEAMQVTKAGGFAAFESTDGKFIFYAKFDAPGLWRIPVDGGEEKLILDKLQPGLWGYWAVADKGIYFVNASAKPHPAIEFFSFAAQQVTRVALMEKDPALGNPGLAVSLDGRHILYAQVDQSGSDIMLVQNFH